MKKIFGIISATLLLASGLLFTSCGDEEVTEVLAGPTNTWCRMAVDYKNSESDDSSSPLYAYFYYTDSAKTISGKNIPAGLTIVLTARTEDTGTVTSGLLSALTSNTYLMKTFPKDGNAEVDEGDSSYTFTGTREKWSAIYWAKKELRENRNVEVPSQLSGTGVDWSAVKNNFSWKRLLANYLLSVLDA